MSLKKNINIILVAALLPLPLFAEIPKPLTDAFKTGNAKSIAEYFNNSIELVVQDKDGIYSKNQAEQILLKFFTENPPSAFHILHEGEKQSPKYAIGSLKTNNGEFRIYFLIKFVGNKQYIQQLRIEQEDD